MKIIDKHKDYYDYIVSIMGMDEKVTYDRRGSTVIAPSEPYEFEFPGEYDLYFSKKPFKCDAPKRLIRYWESSKYEERVNRRTGKWNYSDRVEEGSIYHLLLEVGYYQFIFEVERYLDKNGKLVVDVRIVNKRRVSKDKKKTEAPLSIAPLRFKYCDVEEDSKGIDNPILSKTWIPGYIPAQDMWNMLYEYISSLNDKEFTDTRTNEQHIESHGFDKKISFRKRK